MINHERIYKNLNVVMGMSPPRERQGFKEGCISYFEQRMQGTYCKKVCLDTID